MYITYNSTRFNDTEYHDNKNPCILLNAIVQHIKSRVVEDSILTGSEAQEFMGECDHLLSLSPKVALSVADYKSTALQKAADLSQENLTKETNVLIKRVSELVATTKELANELLKEEEKQEKKSSVEKTVQWNTKDRPLLVKKTREYAQTESDVILPRINDLSFYYQLDEAFNQHSVKLVREFMSEECYWFWVANFGYATMESSWDQFINGYELLYGTLDPHVMKSMEQLLCQDNKVSVARLIIATRKHSNQFPFTKNIGSSSLSTTSVAPETKDQMSEEKRMQLTEMAMELVEKFSDVKMGNHLVSIYSWYRGYDKKDKKAMRERANEWAELIKERRKILGENKKELLQVKHEEAERIDQARRAVYFFYEQFVTIWRVGEVTREILKSVDFPGKGRMRDFLNYVAPLDQANFYVIIGGSKGKDDEKKDYRPKLYDFMEMYLTILEQQSKEHKEHTTSQ